MFKSVCENAFRFIGEVPQLLSNSSDLKRPINDKHQRGIPGSASERQLTLTALLLQVQRPVQLCAVHFGCKENSRITMSYLLRRFGLDLRSKSTPRTVQRTTDPEDETFRTKSYGTAALSVVRRSAADDTCTTVPKDSQQSWHAGY